MESKDYKELIDLLHSFYKDKGIKDISFVFAFRDDNGNVIEEFEGNLKY